MIRILLIRHATTDAVGKRLSGRLPGVHLDKEGEKQSNMLADRMVDVPVAAIYSSPLERALETAAPIAKMHRLNTITSDNFLEIDFGTWTNCSFEQIQNDPAFQRFNSFRSVTRIPGGESMLEAQARIITGLQQLHAKHVNETVAVISHSDLIKAAIAYYAGIHLDMFQRIEISPASVSILEIFEETARILLINHIGEVKNYVPK
jgi:probable phosphoglycerate mutase